MSRAALLASAALLLAACGQVAGETPVEAPPRPDGVPQSAIWLGGLDGGWWYDCSFEEDGLVTCLNHHNGDGYIARQTFKLCAPANPSELAGYMSGSMDERVGVRRGVVELVPVGPAEVLEAGQISDEMTEKSARQFEEALAGRYGPPLDLTCPTRLTPNAPDGLEGAEPSD